MSDWFWWFSHFLSPSPVKFNIQSVINSYGLAETLFRYCVQAPVLEEILYRGPVWLSCIVLKLCGRREFSKYSLIWLILIVPTSIWAYNDHPYSTFYETIIWFGGFTNGCLIINLLEKHWGWPAILGALPIVVVLHSFVNAVVIFLILKFF